MADVESKTQLISCCKCSLEYVSVGCNRTPLCVDWGRNGWVAYGACYSVALYRPKRTKCDSFGRVELVLNGHKDRVNCVKWIPRPGFEKENELVSGSTDKTVIVWQRKAEQDCTWEVSAILEGHQGAVNSVAAITDKRTRTIIVSASADSSVRIWDRKQPGNAFTCLQTVSFGNGFILALAISIFPETAVPVIACGGEDSKVHLFTEKDDKFVKVQSLPGHEDWIRGAEFALEDGGDLLLASCSQDGFIRIWRIALANKSQEANSDALQDAFEELKLTSNVFSVIDKGVDKEFSVVLESVLTGHEGWIYGVHWHPAIRKGNTTFAWSQLNLREVCFECRGDHHGTIYNFISEPKLVAAMKLVYKGGEIRQEKPSHLPEERIHQRLGLAVVRHARVDESYSDELVFTNFGVPFYLEKHQELRIWCGEDLKNRNDADNQGRVCVDVYIKFY
ncbi:Elongator subunit elp2 [Desmophyllum pertusum]|uniref:Elongator complex protein 2 n=1 Tax=Desmophyllum pertusum TaxID=174260 RepID=A0A9X0CVG5_9CNID|nr:Elongator subunit elp2 [Desmophyllum pertusum]